MRRIRLWPTLCALVLLALAANANAQISPGKLSAAHAEFEGVRNCTRCHAGGNQSADDKCLACHEGIAFLVEQGRGLHARLDGESCAECHPEHAGRDFELIDWSGKDAEDFDHARSGWPLEGSHTKAKCRDCHQPAHQARNVTLRMQSKHLADSWLGLQPDCGSCHQDAHQGRLGTDCKSCHTVEQWHGVKDFDHSKTDYPLRGKHAKVDCEKCHQNGRFATSARTDAKWVFAGLPTNDCAKCHQDVHKGRFGVDCARCHVVDGFQVVSAETFDHDKTRYPLRGAHRSVACARCHDESKGGWGAKPTFDRCDACHADPHNGTASLAGQVVDCEECHGLSNFRTSTFDVARHAKTDYPLEGKHATVDCDKCHRPATPAPRLGKAGIDLRPATATCMDCHRDPHAGQLSGEALRCDRCHAVAGFRPSLFDLAAHAQLDFALEGAHEKVDCRHCHASIREGLDVLDRSRMGEVDFALVGVETQCSDCHVDVHGGRYSQSADGRPAWSCTACHSAAAFRPSSVDLELHEKFRFSLEGAHRATPCFLCHTNLSDPPLRSTLVRGADGNARRKYHDVPTACEACHTKGVPR